MAGMRMSMRKIREVLRLTHELGLSVRQLSISWNCSLRNSPICRAVREATGAMPREALHLDFSRLDLALIFTRAAQKR